MAGLSRVGLWWVPALSVKALDSPLSVVFVITMSVAIILLGPGAYSLDARLFGRRKIIIPRPHRSPKISFLYTLSSIFPHRYSIMSSLRSGE